MTPHRSRIVGALIGLLTGLLLPACESGRDIDGRVITRDVEDRSRPLHVFSVTAPMLDGDRIGQADPAYIASEIAFEPRIPDEEAGFESSELGCHDGEVAVVAWAPVTERGGGSIRRRTT